MVAKWPELLLAGPGSDWLQHLFFHRARLRELLGCLLLNYYRDRQKERTLPAPRSSWQGDRRGRIAVGIPRIGGQSNFYGWSPPGKEEGPERRRQGSLCLSHNLKGWRLHPTSQAGR